MVNYAILRIKKYASLSSARGSERHSAFARDRVQHLEHPENSERNIYKYTERYSECTNLSDCYHLATKDVKRKIRSDAVKIVEVVLSASDTNSLPLQDWVNANVHFLKAKFGTGFVSLALHMDETQPHLHAFLIPIITGKDGDRLCAREWFGGVAKLQKLQDDYASDMAQFGLERGTQGSKSKHIEADEYWKKNDIVKNKDMLL